MAIKKLISNRRSLNYRHYPTVNSSQLMDGKLNAFSLLLLILNEVVVLMRNLFRVFVLSLLVVV